MTMTLNTELLQRLQPTNCLNVFDHFVGLALTWLKYVKQKI